MPLSFNKASCLSRGLVAALLPTAELLFSSLVQTKPIHYHKILNAATAILFIFTLIDRYIHLINITIYIIYISRSRQQSNIRL